MAHQVFVSYATEDAEAAAAVCALLEADGIGCWIAPRDVKAGTDYAASIMSAIRNSELALLVFSVHSNASPYALREVERAVAHGRPALGIRIDDAHPNPSVEYYLDEWIEAPQGIESRHKEIIDKVRQRLAQPSAALKTSRGRAARAWYRRAWVVAVAATLVVAAVALGLTLALTRDHAARGDGTAGGDILWSRLDPEGTRPSPREEYAMACDPASGRLIVFGGAERLARLNDTWAYDPGSNTWSEPESLGALPSARSGHLMAYDPVTRRLILFGGFTLNGHPLSDMWAYDPVAKAWAELKPSGALPPTPFGDSLAYDPVTRRLILVGSSLTEGALFDETWAYDPAANTWAELQPTGASPPATSGHSLAYDSGSRRLMLFGGSGAGGSVLNETWAYDPDGNSWAEVEPPSPVPPGRVAHAMAYDVTSGRLIMLGGRDAAGANLDDAWAYDSMANSWTQLKPSATRPSARSGQSIVYEPASGRLVMFGGRLRAEGELLDDLWACSTD